MDSSLVDVSLAAQGVTTGRRYANLVELESRSIFVIREAFAKFENLAMLWSIGKDSSVLLWLARKAFFGHVPFPCVHIDTSYEIPEVIAYRDALAKEWGIELVVGSHEAALAEGRTFPNGKLTRVECCSLLKKDALQQVLDAKGYTAVFVGVRRDEEGTRAKERYFSPRGKDSSWNFKNQPPELWDQFKTDFEPGTHLRIHPLLHWTEMDIWQYIDQEQIPVVPQYFATDGIRYRSLGCVPCTGCTHSQATTVAEILEELQATKIPERSGRAQDHESEDAFEKLRAQGYM